jgi:hypothetical protein
MRALGRAFSWTMCVTFAALSLTYNALIPIGESPDELSHWLYVRTILDDHRLPGARDQYWQGHQAPLYYVVAAAWVGAMESVAGCRAVPATLPGQVNPHFNASPDWNFMVHPTTERLGAWRCEEWMFHLGRLLSTALTVPMILAAIGILRLAAPDAPGIVGVGAALVALVPSHVVMSAMFNNDALVNLLIVATTYFAMLACRTGDATALAKAVALGGLACTAKLSGLYLFGLVLAAVALRRDLVRGLARPGRTRAWVATAAACALLPLLVLARNLREWSDPFAVSALEDNLVKLIAAGVYPEPPGLLHYYLVEVRRLLTSGFAVAYGAVNYGFTAWIDFGKWGARIALAGLALSVALRSAWQRVDPRAFVLLGVGGALFFATYFYPGYRYRWLQARYFFNQLPLIGLLAAIGLQTLADGARRLGAPVPDRMVVAVVYAALVGLNLVVLGTGVVPRLYRYIG